jgi:hypothetical protein
MIDNKQILRALIRGLKQLIALLEMVEKGQQV